MNSEAMLIRPKPIGRKLKRALCKLLGQAILWISIAAITIMAVPAGVLVLMITGIWHLTDHILAKLDRRE